MAKTYSGLVHINGNLLTAVDVETTGRRAGYHEIIQIAIVPLDSSFNVVPDLKPFYTTVRPDYPERQEVQSGYVHNLDINEIVLHAPSKGRVQDLLVEWFNRLELPVGKNLTPLAHGWEFEASFLRAWLGVDLVDSIFHFHARDAMRTALSINDRSILRGEPAPFNRVGLGSLCRKFGIPHEGAHDAYQDCVAEAEVYKNLLQLDF